MTRIAPISRATLDAVVLNDNMESVLTLGAGPQTLALELTNLTQKDITLGDAHGTSLALTFRPGALQDPAGVSTVQGGGWSTAVSGAHIPTIVLTHAGGVTIKPGKKHVVMLQNLTPSANGASRSTRIEMAYSDVKVAGGATLSGRRTLHLSLLFPNVPMGQVLGQKGTTGNFKAELLSSADIIRGGHNNEIRVQLSTSAPVPIKGNPTGQKTDDCAKISYSFPTLEVDGDHIQLSGDIHTLQDTLTIAGAGQPMASFSGAGFTGSSLRNNTPLGAFENVAAQQPVQTRTVVTNRWEKHPPEMIYYASPSEEPLNGDFLEFGLSIKTHLKPGSYPLVIRIENVNGQNVDIALLLNVTSMGLPGHDPKNAYINAASSLTIDAPQSTFQGNLTVDKRLTVGEGRIDLTHGLYFGTSSSAGSNWFYFRNNQGLSQFFIRDYPDRVSIGTGTNVNKNLHIQAGNHVGINTKSPKTTLDVAGRTTAQGLTTSDSINMPHDWKIYTTATQMIFMCGDRMVLNLLKGGNAWVYGALAQNAKQRRLKKS